MGNPVVRQIMLVVCVASVMWWLAKLSFLVVLILTIVAGVFAVSLWTLRYERAISAAAYKNAILKPLIDGVCRIAREQPPVEGKSLAEDEDFALKSREDFDAAKAQMKNYTRGHDDVLERIFRHLTDAVTLRQQRVAAPSIEPPLGAFLLVGSEGVGRRYLARILARMLFRNGGAVILDMDRVGGDPVAEIFGGPAVRGSLVEAVRRDPHQVVIIEHFENSPPEVVEQLATIFRTGAGTDLSTGRPISYRNCVFMLTTARCIETLAKMAARQDAPDSWLAQANHVLEMEGSFDSKLMASLTDILICRPPDDLVKAEVLVMLMAKECKTYGVELDYVDPEVIASEVLALRDELGFTIAPDRIKRLLRDPLVAASERRMNRMSLKVTSNKMTAVP